MAESLFGTGRTLSGIVYSSDQHVRCNLTTSARVGTHYCNECVRHVASAREPMHSKGGSGRCVVTCAAHNTRHTEVKM